MRIIIFKVIPNDQLLQVDKHLDKIPYQEIVEIIKIKNIN